MRNWNRIKRANPIEDADPFYDRDYKPDPPRPICRICGRTDTSHLYSDSIKDYACPGGSNGFQQASVMERQLVEAGFRYVPALFKWTSPYGECNSLPQAKAIYDSLTPAQKGQLPAEDEIEEARR